MGSTPSRSLKVRAAQIGCRCWTTIPSNIPLPSGLVKSGEALRYKRLNYLQIQYGEETLKVKSCLLSRENRVRVSASPPILGYIQQAKNFHCKWKQNVSCWSCALSIMENILGYELSDGGSIPSGRTKLKQYWTWVWGFPLNTSFSQWFDSIGCTK